MAITTATTTPPRTSRPGAQNPGPSWGYRFLRACDRLLPHAVFRPLRIGGVWIAVAAMPAQRRHSREYLAAVLGRMPRLRDVFRHFLAFEETLMLRLRVTNGRSHACKFSPDATGFRSWMDQSFPALLGTFHIGDSDLLGFLVSERAQRRLSLVRLRVGNSHDTDRLHERFRKWVRIIWINDPADLLFALKESAEDSDGIALQCDRLEFSARSESFDFLGARRRFPFTIYHLALILGRPVIMSVGVPNPDGEGSVLHDSPVFAPQYDEPREAALARAREHFQAFLHQVEKLLRANPYLWFNFIPLNPPDVQERS